MWTCALLLLQTPPPQRFEDSLAPLIRANCVECHAGARPKGDLNLKAWVDGSTPMSIEALREPLSHVRDRLFLDEMPPASRARPEAAQFDRAMNWLDAQLGTEQVERPTLRRLNRSEYERTVRDLFGVSYPTRALFPADDVGAMFDNDSAVASVSELEVERWVEAAELVAARALPPATESKTQRFDSKSLALDGQVSRKDAEISLFSSGKVSARADFPRAGRYRIEITAFGDLAGDELPRVSIELDGRPLTEREVHVGRGETETLELTNNVEAGEHDLAARFVNDFFAAGSADKKRQDRNLYITALSVVGPLDPPPVTEFSQWIDAALANGSFETALSALGLRVWRRPLEPAELARLAALSPSTAPPRERARSALVGLLASPNFLYRIETTTPGAALSGFELATRLSYFLWDSAPDRRLFKLAASNELNDPKILAAEIQRMLVDARSRSLVEEFGAQWLGWRALERATPDLSTFPSADEALLSSMRQESEAFFEAMLRENRPLDEFLDADFTFVDERLAKLYGIEGVIGEGVRRVHLSDRDRGGLLGQAAILTATSNPTRTSPVKRGKWVLETLLGSSVPPPPPGVGALSEAIPGVKPKSVREQLDLHRTKQDCASCHSKLDPIGFALEGFDAIGQRRMFDGENPVDCRGKLDDGTEVNGVLELKQYLQAHGTFPQSMARALFLYALGRAPSRIEERDLAKCVDELPADQKTISSLIEIICRQPAFSHAGVP